MRGRKLRRGIKVERWKLKEGYEVEDSLGRKVRGGMGTMCRKGRARGCSHRMSHWI